MRYARWMLMASIALMLVARANAVAQKAAADSILDARTRDVASQLRCPVCQGLSIQDSPSELSQQMRDIVKQQLAQGRTPDEVKQYFVERYGEWILMRPAAHGFNWMVYALPLLALGAGGAVIAVAFRRWTAVSPQAVESPTASREGSTTA